MHAASADASVPSPGQAPEGTEMDDFDMDLDVRGGGAATVNRSLTYKRSLHGSKVQAAVVRLFNLVTTGRVCCSCRPAQQSGSGLRLEIAALLRAFARAAPDSSAQTALACLSACREVPVWCTKELHALACKPRQLITLYKLLSTCREQAC